MKFSFTMVASLLLIGFSLICCEAQSNVRGRQKGSPSGARPNIVFILVDDMGWGDLSAFYQNERAQKTPSLPSFSLPHLDSFASKGVQLRQHYSGASVCAPSRASIVTGRHQGNARSVRDNTFDYPVENTQTIASVLRQAGYATALVGKWGIGGGRESAGDMKESSAHPLKRGFDFFFGYMDHLAGHCHYPTTDTQSGPDHLTAVWECENNQERELNKDCRGAYSTDLFTARAKKWIVDQHQKSPQQPFFVFLTLTAPHGALEIPSQAYPAGFGVRGGVQWTGQPNHIINTTEGKIDSYVYPEYVGKNWPESAKRHASMLRRVDEAVADIEATLSDLNVAENTLVVFASDNGPHKEAGAYGRYAQNPQFFRSYGPFDGIKRDAWEGGFRVPALVKWPRYLKSSIENTPGQFHDWMATFCDVAGVSKPAASDGVSLLPRLLGKAHAPKSTVYMEYCEGGTTPGYKDFAPQHQNARRGQEQVVFVDGYKGVRVNIKNQDDDFQIFDVKKDLQETHDLAKSSPQFEALQEKMKTKALQLRRGYDYVHNVRGRQSSTFRPYDGVPVPSDVVQKTTPGIHVAITQGAFAWVPDFSSLPDTNKVKTCTMKKISVGKLERGAMEFKGYLDIPEEGDYIFYLTTDKDKGSKAFMRLHEMALVDADNEYVSGTRRDSSAAVATSECGAQTGSHPQVRLKAGRHAYTLTYVHQLRNGHPELTLEWKRPESQTIDKIPESAFAISQ